MQNWKSEFFRSIKSAEAEDPIDLVFYRPLGFLLAKLGWTCRLSPTQITLAGMAVGVWAGVLFSQPTLLRLTIGTLLFLLSGILDSADGQLARISGQSTPFGLVVDGLCDNIVFISVYIGCIWPLLPTWGLWIWPLAVAAGLCHSWQSATLDFYSREYLHYTTEYFSEHYRNPYPLEALTQIRAAERQQERWLWRLRYSWLCQQQFLNTRTKEARDLYQRWKSADAQGFRTRYRKLQLRQLRLWQPLGANSHTFGIILFAYLARFHLYLVIVDLTILNLWALVAWKSQRMADRRMVEEAAIHAKMAAIPEVASTNELRKLRRSFPGA